MASSCAYQDLYSDEISHLYNRTTSYPTEKVFFKEVNHVLG